MNSKIVKIIYVEDNLKDLRLFQKHIRKIKNIKIELIHVEGPDKARALLEEKDYDIVFIKLFLPEQYGLDEVSRLCMQSPDVPVVVMTDNYDENTAIKALKIGAEEYIVNKLIKSNSLERIIRFAIIRHRARSELRVLSLIDELTGLYNRRGFAIFGRQQLGIAQRSKQGMVLFFIDLDGLKEINDKFGHHNGDIALVRTANILKKAFRGSDIIGRFGGDEFTALAIDSSETHEKIMIARLYDELAHHNSQEGVQFKLSFSVGSAHYNKNHLCSIEDLIKEADKVMYEQKKIKGKEILQ